MEHPLIALKEAGLALDVQNVTHRYQKLAALNELSLQVAAGQIFGVLGPNGSGKSTLFRLVCTLSRIQSGTIRVSGFCTQTQTQQVRSQLGVVFQSPSLDRKLSALENIRCQASLYGLKGSERDSRINEMVSMLGLQDKLHVRCEKLSGGQKRRVELAKGLLHRPSVLLLDEPSTGLDPAARLDLWQALVELKKSGTSVILTTHLLEEADKCDCVAILNAGAMVACDRPDALRSESGSMVVTISSNDPQLIANRLQQRLNMSCIIVDQQVRIAATDAMELLPVILEETTPHATSVTVGRPSLEDVFIAKTGHKFHSS